MGIAIRNSKLFIKLVRDLVKSRAGPNFRVEDPLIYIQKLNWLNNWIDKYFFTKVSDFLFAVFMCILIVSVIFRENIKLKFQSSFKKCTSLYVNFFTIYNVVFKISISKVWRLRFMYFFNYNTILFFI